jgi:hypothetical protein
MSTQTSTLHFINNDYVPSLGGETFEVINPTTEELAATVAAAQSRDVDRAVSLPLNLTSGNLMCVCL